MGARALPAPWNAESHVAAHRVLLWVVMSRNALLRAGQQQHGACSGASLRDEGVVAREHWGIVARMTRGAIRGGNL